jgi:surfactin synthase thioesterase subunit
MGAVVADAGLKEAAVWQELTATVFSMHTIRSVHFFVLIPQEQLLNPLGSEIPRGGALGEQRS